MLKITSNRHPAILVLENGMVFHGKAIGKIGSSDGEVIFNTAMTGYQEILTDPSYAEQIINFTCTHIGNVGTNFEDYESRKVWANGIIVRDLSDNYSNWRAKGSFETFLLKHNVIGISEIDTRALTRIIRSHGSLRGRIVSTAIHKEENIESSLLFTESLEENLVAKVSTKKILSYYKTLLSSYHVVVYDFGVKNSSLETLKNLGCHITVVPYNTTLEALMRLEPDGVLLSNGPGDPSSCKEALVVTRGLLKYEIPIFGICLGHQILALACGAKTYKMKYGHHGANHPVLDIASKKVFITSQNHSYAVEEESLPNCLTITHRSLLDSTIQGIKHISKPAFSFQGHPEASPGPHDISHLFEYFLQSIHSRKIQPLCIKKAV